LAWLEHQKKIKEERERQREEKESQREENKKRKIEDRKDLTVGPKRKRNKKQKGKGIVLSYSDSKIVFAVFNILFSRV